jgi:hypothetical protein
MKFFSKGTAILFSMLGLTFFSGCGMWMYPGQPGVVTNNYSKIDYEDLESEGLYVYEATYDNRPGGPGVQALVTKLYPNAQTNTSNVRTNSDGTLYHVKTAYAGAVIQMISIPSENLVLMPPDSTIQLMLQYTQSMNEVDDQNLAEANIFANAMPPTHLAESTMSTLRTRLDLLRRGTLLHDGSLSYQVTEVDLGKIKFVPTQPIEVVTNFFQNSVKTNTTSDSRKEMATFIETNFPKGFKGQAKVYLGGTSGQASQPMSFNVGLNTVNTAKAAGVKIVVNATHEELERAMQKYHLSK